MAEPTAFSNITALRRYIRREATWGLFFSGTVGVYVLLVPSLSLIPSLSPYNEKRALQVGLLILVGGGLLVSRSARRQWLSVFQGLPRAAHWGLSTVLGLGLLSAALAPSPFHALLEIGHFVLLFVAAGGVAMAVRRAPRWTERLLLGAVVTSALLYAVSFSVSYGTYVFLPRLQAGQDALAGFSNVRFLNQYQAWTLPLLGAVVLALPDRWCILKVLVFGILSLWWTLLFGAVARGALLATIVAATCVLCLFRRRALRWGAIQGGALVLGLGLYYVLFTSEAGGTPAVIEKADDTGSYVGRIAHWQICLEMVRAHPWLGAGPMHYAWPPINFMPAAHPHNAFMQWLGEWGVPSTLIMSSLTIWGGSKWIMQEEAIPATKKDSKPVRVALVASVLAGAAYAMISGVLVMPVSQMLLVLIGGWAWGRYRHKTSRDVSSPSGSAQIVLGALLLASVTVVGSSARALATIDERHSAFEEAAGRTYYSPRYWMQGYLQVRDPEVIERARTEPEDDFSWTGVNRD